MGRRRSEGRGVRGSTTRRTESSGHYLSQVRRWKRCASSNFRTRHGYLFPSPTVVLDPKTGKAQLDAPYEHFDARWYAALETAGISNFRFHDLRHTTTSMLAAQGASLLEIADLLGHKTLAMVKRYSHLVVEHKAKVIEKMIVAKGL